MKLRAILIAALSFMAASCATTKIDYTATFVPEEGGINFTKVTYESSEALTNPGIRKSHSGRLEWWTNPLFDISSDGSYIAFNILKDQRQNIFVRSANGHSTSTQRTFRNRVQDICYSPDGKSICFSELAGAFSYIYLTSATQGTIVQQISSPNVCDYGPRYSKDGSKIFFCRQEIAGFSIWSYDVAKGTLSNYGRGMNPYPINDEEYLCTRENTTGNNEIWLVNYVKGTESVILSQENHGFSTASLSPDGKWILCVGNTIPNGDNARENTDIYVVRSDGSMLTQLTYHLGNDCSPVWSPDGKKIYFLSQRGTANGEYNIWSMNFTL